MQNDAHRLAHRVRMQPHRERIRIAREAEDAAAAAALAAAPAPAGAPDAGGAAEDGLPIDTGPAVPSPSEDGDAFMKTLRLSWTLCPRGRRDRRADHEVIRREGKGHLPCSERGQFCQLSFVCIR